MPGRLLLPCLTVWSEANVPLFPPHGVYTTPMNSEHLALYAGSFDPITFGHLDVVRRSRRLFDRIVVGVGQNPDKSFLFSLEERTAVAQALVAEMQFT